VSITTRIPHDETIGEAFMSSSVAEEDFQKSGGPYHLILKR